MRRLTRAILLLLTGLVLALEAPVTAQTVFTMQPAQVAGITVTTLTRNSGFLPSNNYGAIDILFRVTAGGTATGVLQVFIEDTSDGGTTWDDLCSTNTFTFGAAVANQRFFVGGGLATTATNGTAAAVETLAAGTCRQGPFGDRFRIREKVSGIAASPVGPTYTITAVLQ